MGVTTGTGCSSRRCVPLPHRAVVGAISPSAQVTGRTCIDDAGGIGRNLVYGRRSSCIFPLTPTMNMR